MTYYRKEACGHEQKFRRPAGEDYTWEEGSCTEKRLGADGGFVRVPCPGFTYEPWSEVEARITQLEKEVVRLSQENASFRECPNEGDCVAGLMPSYRDQVKDATERITQLEAALGKQTRAVEKLRPHLESMDAWYDPVVSDVEAKVASLLLRYNDIARTALTHLPEGNE